MAIPKQLLAMELLKAAPPPPQPHIASCWAQLGALWSCHQPSLFPGKGVLGERTPGRAQGPVPGNEALAGGLCVL